MVLIGKQPIKDAGKKILHVGKINVIVNLKGVLKMPTKSKKKVGQFGHYKKWTTDEGYSFLARDKEDAELYVQTIGGQLGKIKEVIGD
jgi:hypothetical protein